MADQYLREGETFAGIEQLEAARSIGAPKGSEKDLAKELAMRYATIGEPEIGVEALTPYKADRDCALQLSQLYLTLGLFRESAEALKPLRDHFSSLRVDAQQALVRTYLLAGEAEVAEKLMPPDTGSSPEWQSLAGIDALIARKPTQAVPVLKQSVALNPQDGWTSYLYGKALLQSGNSQSAIAAFREAVQSRDAPAQALTRMAILAANSDSLAEADALLDRVQGEDRKLPDFWRAAAVIAHKRGHGTVEQVSLGYAAYNEGDPWLAESIWLKAVPAARDDIARDIYVALVNGAIRRSDTDTALKYATVAAIRWPKDPETIRQYSETLLAQNQLKPALAAAQSFQALAPADMQAQAAELLSRIALDSNDASLLSKSVEKNRAESPADPMPLLHQAEWQGAQGRDPANLERTLALYNQALAIAPKNAEAAAHGALLLADLKRNDEAIPALLHALTLNPRVMDGSVNVMLVQLYQRTGAQQESRFEEAWYRRVRQLKDSWPTLLKSLRQAPSASTASEWKALGELALRRHESWIALCAFHQWTLQRPTDAAAWQDLAAAQKRFGRFDDALDSMRKAAVLRR